MDPFWGKLALATFLCYAVGFICTGMLVDFVLEGPRQSKNRARLWLAYIFLSPGGIYLAGLALYWGTKCIWSGSGAFRCLLRDAELPALLPSFNAKELPPPDAGRLSIVEPTDGLLSLADALVAKRLANVKLIHDKERNE